jgi:Rrf2 family protein
MAYGISFTQALYVLIFVADKMRLNRFEMVPTSLISEALNLPRPSAAKILKQLNQAGIVETATGVKGGVCLAKEPQQIRLYDIFRAIEGKKPLFRSDHPLNASGMRPKQVKDTVRELLLRFEHNLARDLADYTLADLVSVHEKS